MTRRTEILRAHGISAELPPGWEGRIYRRRDNGDGGDTRPVLHASTYSLRSETGGDGGDFGSTVILMMGPVDVFVAIVEYAEPPTAEIFAGRTGVPAPLHPGDFHPSVMQRLVAGMAGCQLFFNESGRSFCLYAVIGSYADAATLCAKVNAIIGSIDVSPSVRARSSGGDGT
jgi:hypothetical protein